MSITFRTLRPYLLLFGGLTAVYHSNLRPIPSGDSLCTSLIPFAVLLDGTVKIDRFAPWLLKNVYYAHDVIRFSHGHYYSGHPVGGGLLVTPLYVPLLAFPRLRQWDPGSLVGLARILEKFAATTVAALSSVILLLLLKRLTSSYWAWRLTLVYALCTSTWAVASQALWQHTTGELAIVSALFAFEVWREERRAQALWLCGLCAACALIVRPSNVILLGAIGIGMLIARASIGELVRLAAIPVAFGAAVFAYNLYFFKHPTGTYEFPMWAGSAWTGLAGLFFSPGRGLLIYMPIVAFALLAFTPAAEPLRRKHAPLVAAAILFAALHAIVMSRVTLWWGGYCWGPRYLTEILPVAFLLMALATPLLERPWIKRGFATVVVYCLLIQILGVYFYPKGHWDHTPVPIDSDGGRNWNWRDNPIRRTLAGGPTWEPYVIVGTALTKGIGEAQRKMRELGIQLY